MEDRSTGLSGTHAWLAGFRFWDVYFVVSLLVSALFVAHVSGFRALGASIAIVLLLSQVGWYLLLGRSVIRAEEIGPSNVRYAAIAAITFVATCFAAPPGSISLLALIPLMFWALAPAPALATTVALALVPTVVEAIRIGSVSEAIGDQWKLALGLIAGCATFGAWISNIIQQSQDRAKLIDELTTTREELARASERAGADAERARLAGDIHDAVAQSLNSIVMLSQAVSHSLAENEWDESRRAEAARHVDLVESTAREALDETSALIDALQPPALSHSLLDALKRLAARHFQASGLPVQLHMAGAPTALSVSQEVAVLRLAQEAMSNVARHAEAQSAEIRLSWEEDSVSLTVTDDGVGFDTAKMVHGHGLAGMRARAAACGGAFEVQSSSEGTTVNATIAVDRRTNP